MISGYRDDLAYIHDTGFTGYVRRSVPGLLGLLYRHGIKNGLVVDLGCGSGVWLRELCDRGYETLGVDISRAMLSIARKRSPQTRFVRASLFEAEIPPCAAITAIGECFNYCFNGTRSPALGPTFRRIHKALNPGGLFIFDIATPGRVGSSPTQNYFQGKDWAILVRNQENARRRRLTRSMVIFRKVGRLYHRTEEVHHQRLFEPRDVIKALEKSGFVVRVEESYGRFLLGHGRAVFIARKRYPRAFHLSTRH